MGIECSFTLRPGSGKGRFLPIPRKETGINGFLHTLERTAEEFQCHAEVSKRLGCIRVSFCPQGRMTLRIEGETVHGEWLVNMTGAGFHACAVDFLDLVCKRSGYDAEVTDSSGYYQDRNFEKLRNENMLSWLEEILTTVLAEKNRNMAFAVGWDAEDYYPEVVSAEVFTPLGKYSYQDLARIVGDTVVTELADRFFIWDGRKKDARFYRNAALAMLWHDCYFRPSAYSPEDRTINEAILDHLQKAAKLDNTLPFPKKEYLELCKLCAVKPMELSGLPDYDAGESVGYRRETIIERVGAFDIHIAGRFLRSYDAEEETDVFTAPKEYHFQTTARFRSFTLNQPAAFGDYYDGEDVDEALSFNTPVTRVKAAMRHTDGSEGRVFSILAQVIHGGHMLLASFRYDDPEEREWALDLLGNVMPNDF